MEVDTSTYFDAHENHVPIEENSLASKKENSQVMKIRLKITKESSQVKKENSQVLKIIKKGTKEGILQAKY